ncbi:MAG: ABC transporter substrate-binding protein [Deltaproteobacteria bacterium]|nr:ABC transporter substrate-binding protein [Deltaproteobacteria bacterium]
MRDHPGSKWLRRAAVVVLLLSLSLGAWDLRAEETFPLGVALGLTGTGATYSKDAVAAIRLAVEEINAKGGLLGRHPIRLFVADTRTNPGFALGQAKKLIDDNKVKAIIGTYSSATALAIKPVCQESRVLHIATISNSEDITRLKFSPYTYSVVPNTYMQSKAVALGVARLAKEKKWATYCTIASDYAWGRSSQELAVKFLKELVPKFKLAHAYWPPIGEKNFVGYIATIYSHKPDCVIGFLAGEDNAEWMKQARYQDNLFRKIAYPGSLISVTELMDQASTIERGLIGLARAPFFAHMDVPGMAGFVKGFRAKYNRYPSDWAVLSYDGVHILRQGVERAGCIDDRVHEAMKGMTVETCRGKLSFREIDNQLSCSSYMGYVTDDPRYPFPIYGNLMEIKGPESWRAEVEILEARAR